MRPRLSSGGEGGAGVIHCAGEASDPLPPTVELPRPRRQSFDHTPKSPTSTWCDMIRMVRFEGKPKKTDEGKACSITCTYS